MAHQANTPNGRVHPPVYQVQPSQMHVQQRLIQTRADLARLQQREQHMQLMAQAGIHQRLSQQQRLASMSSVNGHLALTPLPSSHAQQYATINNTTAVPAMNAYVPPNPIPQPRQDFGLFPVRNIPPRIRQPQSQPVSAHRRESSMRDTRPPVFDANTHDLDRDLMNDINNLCADIPDASKPMFREVATQAAALTVARLNRLGLSRPISMPTAASQRLQQNGFAVNQAASQFTSMQPQFQTQPAQTYAPMGNSAMPTHSTAASHQHQQLSTGTLGFVPNDDALLHCSRIIPERTQPQQRTSYRRDHRVQSNQGREPVFDANRYALDNSLMNDFDNLCADIPYASGYGPNSHARQQSGQVPMNAAPSLAPQPSTIKQQPQYLASRTRVHLCNGHQLAPFTTAAAPVAQPPMVVQPRSGTRAFQLRGSQQANTRAQGRRFGRV